jgi:hypothetical protein
VTLRELAADRDVLRVSNSTYLQKYFWNNAKFDTPKNIPGLEHEVAVLDVRTHPVSSCLLNVTDHEGSQP